ncbi:MAG: two-component system, OmpR family, alkaline phosphatase synthesis response regulator PhoP [Clostridia bacterium]|nr:two-component system, OmpR family, alkaline phosphatase synthesis response regulator PhoP [Clostridia bacterium]
MQLAKILLVDDELTFQELIKYNLEQTGLEVEIASDGNTALTKAEQMSPTLIILDLMLPGIDGFEVCCRFKANKKTSSIPIIILSAKSEDFEKVLGLELGAEDYITKPFSPRELVARVKVCLRRIATTPQSENDRIKVG